MPRFDVILDNRFAVLPDWWLKDPHFNTDKSLDAYFSYQPKGWEHTIQAANGWDGFVSLLKGERVGAGLFLHRVKALAQQGIHFDIIDNRQWVRFYDASECRLIGRTPYDWHYRAVEFMRENANNGGLVIAPTATGKTSMAGWAFARVAGTGLFIVNDVALGMQTKNELEEILGEPVGFVGDGKFSQQRVTVALVQTLARDNRKADFKRLRNCDLMLIDEVHVMLNNQMWEAVLKYTPRACFGLTATLDLNKSAVALPAYALCGSAVFRYTADDARANGEISEGWGYAFDVATLVDGSGLSYAQLYDQYVVRFDWLNQFVVSLAVQAAQIGYTVLILVKQHSHREALEALLSRAGVAYVTYSGQQSGKVRMVTRAALNSGDAAIGVGTTGTITKGISIPRLNFIIDGSQTKAWENSVQRAGRGGRKNTGKDHFVYVDIGQSAARVRGVKKRNLFALHAAERRKGLQAEGYRMRSRALASTNEATSEAALALDFILQQE